MGGIERRRGREVAPRPVPHVDVPVPIGEARDFVRDALSGTSFVDPVVRAYVGWLAFEPRLRFTPLDAVTTRIEIDLADRVRGASALLYPQRRAEIDRFFVAIEDELGRREGRRRRTAPTAPEIDPLD